MQLYLSLDRLNAVINNLAEAGVVIPKDFKSELINQGNKLRDKAKEVLVQESSRRTGQKYWTGRLYDAIKSEVETGGLYNDVMTGIKVGVDLRTAQYAEWVEIGHRKVSGYRRTEIGGPKVIIGSGEWWEGYHYLEQAYLEVGPDIGKEITDTLRITLTHFSRKGGGTRSKATGRFTKGNFTIK